MRKQDLNAILEAAAQVEEQSIALYTMAKKKAKYASSKKLLEELLKEEVKHKEKLLGIIEDKEKLSELGATSDNIQDLKIVDIMKVTPLSEDADYQGILIYAAKREKVTHDYYRSLAEGLIGADTKNLFLKLAQEELKHKNRLEKEYDEYILKEN